MRGISTRSLYSLTRSLISHARHGIAVETAGGCYRETPALGSLWSALQSRGVKVNAIQVEFLLILIFFRCALFVLTLSCWLFYPVKARERYWTNRLVFLFEVFLLFGIWSNSNLDGTLDFQDVLSGLVVWKLFHFWLWYSMRNMSCLFHVYRL